MDNGRSPTIRATGLRKSYEEKIVLGGVDIAVPEATIFSLLGPNGAGKTTTVQILSASSPPAPDPRRRIRTHRRT